MASDRGENHNLGQVAGWFFLVTSGVTEQFGAVRNTLLEGGHFKNANFPRNEDKRNQISERNIHSITLKDQQGTKPFQVEKVERGYNL